MRRKTESQPSIVCYGEILWDVFPDKIKPGGAPMNVAYHLNRLGTSSALISKVGDDDYGKVLIEHLAIWDLPTSYVEIDPLHPTSTVLLATDPQNEVTYTITENVAWDYILPSKANIELVEAADVLVFGSLALRSAQSYHTLLSLLDCAKTKVLDVNIRLPFFSIEKTKTILKKIDILKLNKAELNFIIDQLEVNIEPDEDQRIMYLQKQFGIQEVLLTKGSKGAIYYKNNEKYIQKAFRIEVKDTVGSGDAFLAGFLTKRFSTKKFSPPELIEYAAAVGAFNTTKEGACPDYSVKELERFKELSINN